MKYIKLLFVSLMALVAASCTPDSYELEAIDVLAEDLVEGVAYSVRPDSEDPNTIYLENLLPGVTPLWEHPQGRSQESKVTLKIPFKGTYSVTYGVITRGGYVYGEPYEFTLETDNLNYVNDPIWNMLSGGVGNEKTWVWDINADGVCKYFVGPLYFYGTDDTWATFHGEAATDYNGDGAIDSWSWAADWAGNGSWLLSSTGAMDYGYMTFDLKDGAHVKVVNNASSEEFNGSYMVDVANYTLKLTDAELLHDPGRDAIVTQWGNCRILELTEDVLQLGVIRDNDPNEGPCLLVYNFISKEYSDNWSPAAPVEPSEPVLPDGWQDTVGKVTTTTTSIKWTLSPDTPINWAKMSGEMMNEWNSAADYPDWLGTPDPTVYEAWSLTMESTDNSYVVNNVDGTTTEGFYTIDEKGVYTFDAGIPSFTVVGWASFATTAENQLRILQIGTNANGSIKDMWLGAKATDKEEYTAFHLIANAGAGGQGGGEPEPAGYEASIYFTNSGWWPSGNGETVMVTGDGTYTAKFNVGAGATDAMVFTVDIKGLRNDYPLSTALVKAVRLDGVDYAFNPANVAYGDLEGNGNLRIEFINEWSFTKEYPAVEPTMTFESEIEVDFEVSFEGGYKGQVMLTNDGWWPGYSGVDNFAVLGVGKYKFSADLSANGAVSSPMIFCIDLLAYPDAATAKAAIYSMKATLSDETSKDLTVKSENLSYGDLEQNGNLRWELFNIYGSTGNGVQSAPYDYSMSVIEGSEFAGGDITAIEFLIGIE